MPKITYVKKAQQRYATVPVLDEHGEPKQTPVMSNGVQKTTKTGRPVFMTVTVADKDQPLPPETCDYSGCGREIAVGSPYKHLTVKTGTYTSKKMSRHDTCPNWQPWDYSNSLSARIARIVHDTGVDVDEATEPGEVESALASAAEQIRELAEEKREAASNMEDGFGAPTEKSEELAQQADDLDAWADEIENADVPEAPECSTCNGHSDVECGECSGRGKVDCPACDGTGGDEDDPCEDCNEGEVECHECDATGDVTCEDCNGEGTDEEAWRDEVNDVVSVLDESPV